MGVDWGEWDRHGRIIFGEKRAREVTNPGSRISCRPETPRGPVGINYVPI